MTAKVWYRIPGMEAAFMQGALHPLKGQPERDGFVIAPFNRDAQGWILYPDESASDVLPALYTQWHFRSAAEHFGDPYPGETYIHWVEEVKSKLIQGMPSAEGVKYSGAFKVVTSRSVFRRLPPEPLRWFERACKLYPQAMVYVFDAPETGCWMGATPEPLLTWEAGHGKTVALAGTRNADAGSDFRQKEKEEQAFISTFIREIFGNLNINFQESALKELQQGHLKHLCTEFVFEAKPEWLWDLARQLHPTPAVCGYQRDAALQLLSAERTERRFYGGFLGPWSAAQGALWVNIRCGELFADGMNLYAGTGITPASNAREEWQEAEQKLRILGAVL